MPDEFDALLREMKLLNEVTGDRPEVPTSWDEDAIAAAFARDAERKEATR